MVQVVAHRYRAPPASMVPLRPMVPFASGTFISRAPLPSLSREPEPPIDASPILSFSSNMSKLAWASLNSRSSALSILVRCSSRALASACCSSSYSESSDRKSVKSDEELEILPPPRVVEAELKSECAEDPLECASEAEPPLLERECPAPEDEEEPEDDEEGEGGGMPPQDVGDSVLYKFVAVYFIPWVVRRCGVRSSGSSRMGTGTSISLIGPGWMT